MTPLTGDGREGARAQPQRGLVHEQLPEQQPQPRAVGSFRRWGLGIFCLVNRWWNVLSGVRLTPPPTARQLRGRLEQDRRAPRPAHEGGGGASHGRHCHSTLPLTLLTVNLAAVAVSSVLNSDRCRPWTGGVAGRQQVRRGEG